MGPFAAANQITRAWRHGRPEDACYPVDCAAIAAELKVKVIVDDQLGDEFEAALLTEGSYRVIVVNASIREPGRRNFCIGHELGHSSLHRDRPELRCTFDDLADVAPHPANIEQEANLFAMTLLMPADDVRRQLDSHAVDLRTVERLSTRYATSLTATALRAIELCGRPARVVLIRDGTVAWSVWNDRMRWPVKKGRSIPAAAISSGMDADSADPDIWFEPDVRARFEGSLVGSFLPMPRYRQTLGVLWVR